jgi:hypothetical protein
MLAHVAGIPVEETIGSFGPLFALLLAGWVGRFALMPRARRWDANRRRRRVAGGRGER